MMPIRRRVVLATGLMLACSPAMARDPVDTVRAAIAAENRKPSSFPPDLYSPVFVSTFHRAINVGPEAETTLTGLYTSDIRLLDAREEGGRVQARIKAKLSSDDPRAKSKFVTKTITFFMAPDGRINDFDTHTQGAHGPQPTALNNLRDALAGR